MNPNLSFRGLADLYLKPYNQDAPARAIGSVSKCSIAPIVDKKSQKNYGRAGGQLSTSERFQGATISLVMQSLSIPNMALAVRGLTSNIASGTVATGSAETHKAYLDGLIRLAYVNPNTVVVKDDTGATTYVNGVDYKVTGAGVIPLSGGDIADGDNVKISYAYSGQQVVEAFVGAADEYTLYFDGINEDDGNRPVVVDLYRLKPNLAKSLDMIGDDYLNLTMDADLLLDATQTGVGSSQYFRWIYGAAAA